MITHVVSVGGGITSTLLLPMRVIEKYGRENCLFIMAALKDDGSHAKPYTEMVERYLGIEITRITRGGEILPHDGAWAKYGIWDIFFETGMMGNPFADPCSRILKREAIAAYMKAHHSPDDTILHVGITANEIDRMLAITANWKRQGYRVEADLAEDVSITRQFAIEASSLLLGYISPSYRMGFPHDNCNKFCVKAGKGHMARLLWYDRETYLYHENNELLHQQMFNHTHTIMRDEWTRAGKRGADPLTMRDFRLRMESRWSGMLLGFDPFDGLEDTPACVFCESVA